MSKPSLRDDESIAIRSVCGRVDGDPVLYEVRIGIIHPTAAMLRKVKAAVDLLVQWAEEDEAEEDESPELHAALGEYRTTARQLDETARIFRDERDAAVARLQTTKAKEDES